MLRLRTLGGFLRTLQLLGESFVCARAHARQFIGQFALGLVADLLEFGGERFTRCGFRGCSRLRNGGLTLGRRFGFDPREFDRALFRGFGANAFEFSRHFGGRFTLSSDFGFDARHFGRALLRRFRANALDLGGHLGRGLALRGSFGFHARHFGRALFGCFGPNTLDFGRHPGIGLCLDQRDLCSVDFGIDAFLDRLGSVHGTARSREFIDRNIELRLVFVFGLRWRVYQPGIRRDFDGHGIDGELVEHRCGQRGQIVLSDRRCAGASLADDRRIVIVHGFEGRCL